MKCLFCNYRKGLLLSGTYPKASINTTYNSIEDLHHDFNIKKYTGCFSSLRKYPINIIVNENHTLWNKYAQLISNIIFQCNYSDYYSIKRIIRYSSNNESHVDYKIPYHRVKINMIICTKVIDFILTIDSVKPQIIYNLNFRNISDYNEVSQN